MTKKLEDTFNIESMKIEEIREEKRELMKTKREITDMLADNINVHDTEVDKYANKSFELAKDAADLAMNSEPRHAAELFNSASSLIKTALDAQNAQIDKKAKLLELEMKKRKLDHDLTGGMMEDLQSGEYASREDILKRNDK